ncbi:MAG: PDDEXK nuclease domain-containing protein [Kiritimatiellaeota bacterium]|nr:PDDEXK nuclease domain-containing protein [Kiritimatiellota bacterium]
MKNDLTLYGSFIKEIKELVYRRQYEALKHVNTELMQLYWEIGGEITRQQHQKGWGKSVVEVLAKELQKEFPGVQGFSARNLWLMRDFYREYSPSSNLQPTVADLGGSNLAQSARDSGKAKRNPSASVSGNSNLPPLAAEISWSKNIVIMQKCKDQLQREFYIRMTKRYGWTKDVLINNIENRAFEKHLTNQTNFDDTLPEKYRLQAKLAVKDDYNFDFLEMGVEHSEAELEAAIINNIRVFLIEMGGEFAFIGNQYLLPVGSENYYIDLLLYHRRLKSLIAIELKVGNFTPEFAGKMQFYLTALDETKKLPDENPSIGIIICKSKERTIVEYALKSSDKPIGVATYSYYDNLPEEMCLLLPSPEAIAAIIREIEGGA